MRRPSASTFLQLILVAVLFPVLSLETSAGQSQNLIPSANSFQATEDAMSIYGQPEALPSEIAFHTCDAYGCRIYIVNQAGMIQQTIAEPGEITGGVYGGVAWSPDGSQIAYTTSQADFLVYAVNADGSNARQVTSQWGGMPDWSPDGSQIVFTGIFALYIHDLDQQIERQITFDSIQPSSPRWSPDGNQIAYCDVGDSGSMAIFVIDPDGSGLRQITYNLDYACFPSWSPDGSQIYFLSKQGDSKFISAISADGSDLRQLAQLSTDTWSTDVSPDESQLLFTVFDGSRSTLEVLNLATDQVRSLAITCPDVCTPRWRPTGASRAADPTLTTLDETTATVSADGQAFAALSNGASVSVDAGIAAGDTITLKHVEDSAQSLPPPADVAISDVYQIEAPTWNSALDAVVTLPISDFDPNLADSYQLAYFDEANHQWIALPSSVDVISGTVSTTMQHFSLVGVWKWLTQQLNVSVATDPSLYQVSYNSGNRGATVQLGDLGIKVFTDDPGSAYVDVDVTMGFESVDSQAFATMLTYINNYCQTARASITDFEWMQGFGDLTNVGSQAASAGAQASLEAICGGKFAPSHPSSVTLLGAVYHGQHLPVGELDGVIHLNNYGLPTLLNNLWLYVQVTDDAQHTVERTVEIPVLSENLPAPPSLLSPAQYQYEICPPRPQFTWNASLVSDYTPIDHMVVRVVRGVDVWGDTSVSEQRFDNDGNGFHTTMTWTPNRPLAAGEYSWGVAEVLAEFKNLNLRDPQVVKATNNYRFRVDPNLSGNQCVPVERTSPPATNTPRPTDTPTMPSATNTPTDTPTPPATELVIAACTVREDGFTNGTLRVGPGTNRAVIGTLPLYTDVAVTGRARIGGELWWRLNKQQAAPQSAASEIWVANSDARTSGNCDVIGEVATPAIIPIAQPTTTPIPAPIQSDSGLPPDVQISFRADQTTLNTGECTYVRWDVEGINSVYYQGLGAVGHSESRECPPSTTTYTLSVILTNGSRILRQLTIIVNGSPSGGSGGCVLTSNNACYTIEARAPLNVNQRVSGIHVTFTRSGTGELIFSGVTNANGSVGPFPIPLRPVYYDFVLTGYPDGSSCTGTYNSIQSSLNYFMWLQPSYAGGQSQCNAGN